MKISLYNSSLRMRAIFQAILLLSFFNHSFAQDQNLKPRRMPDAPLKETTIETPELNIDGIPAVKIGKQIWMKYNLNVSHFRNGDSIPIEPKAVKWDDMTSSACCFYDNDTSMGPVCGRLYNWFEVNDPRGLAPKGWRVPSNKDWAELGNFLGGDKVAGGKLKYPGYDVWAAPNAGATNESGFSALPCGGRILWEDRDIQYICYYWTSSEKDKRTAYLTVIDNENPNVFLKFSIWKGNGYSVRLIRDK